MYLESQTAKITSDRMSLSQIKIFYKKSKNMRSQIRQKDKELSG